MTFEHLSYFAEVYRQKSITVAADNLYVSRQAVSSAIKKLETELNVLLFYRNATGVIPTDAGVKLFSSAQIILQEKSRLDSGILSATKRPLAREIIKIGLPRSILTILGNILAERLSELFPHVVFEFHEIVLKKVPTFQNECDISIVINSEAALEKFYYPNLRDFHMRQIAVIPVYIWIGSTSLQNAKSKIKMEELRDVPFCAWKGAYNGNGHVMYLKHFLKPSKEVDLLQKPAVEIKNSLIQYIESFGYYTIDLPLSRGNFYYSKLFEGHQIKLKQTDLTYSVKMIYRQEKELQLANYFSTIVDTLFEELSDVP